MGFHNIVYPLQLSYGSVLGAGFNTSVSETDSQSLAANQGATASRRAWDLSHDLNDAEDQEKVRVFFYNRKGAANTWLIKDPGDYSTNIDTANSGSGKGKPRRIAPTGTDVVLGTYDGSTDTFQLKTQYIDEAGFVTDKIIRKPIPGTTVISIDGVDINNPTFYSTNLATGEVSISVGNTGVTPGAQISAGTEFYHVARLTEASDRSFDEETARINDSRLSLQAVEDFEDYELPSVCWGGGAKTWENMAAPFTLSPAIAKVNLLSTNIPANVGVRLPNTSGWQEGLYFEIINSTGAAQEIQDATGAAIVSVPDGSHARAYLFDGVANVASVINPDSQVWQVVVFA